MPSEGPQVEIGPLSGERIQVTAFFYDMVGSTALLHQLDPEEFGVIQRMLHNEAAALIGRNGGYLERIQGDGGSAYFGYPQPREDAAEWAVASGLEMVERCQRLARQLKVSLRIRIGIATGVVVVSNTTNTGLPGQMEIIGIAPALAARIQSEAIPDSVAVADTTYRLTSGAFKFEEIGARELKGFGGPVQLWRPVARLPQPDRFTTHRRVSAPLVGRDGELEMCRRRWARAAGGDGQLILLCGDAGMGKSRLITEFRRGLAAEGVDGRVFQCQPRGNTDPLHPLVQSIRQSVAEASNDPEPNRDAIIRFLRSAGSEIDELNAEIVAFLLAGKAQGPSGEAWQIDLSDEEIRERAVEAMLAVLMSFCSTGPSLIVFEDLHWADTLTNALVARLPDRIRSKPILAVVTSRELIDAGSPGDPDILTIALSGLSPQATSELVSQIWEAALPTGLADFVFEKSDGVPLYAEQLALLLGAKAKESAQNRAGWESLLVEGKILNLQDLIMARLSSLGPLRRIAQIAGVIGREFELKLLAALIERESLPVPLDQAIEKLAQAGIVERKSARSPIRFRHVLIQQAAYESLLKSERRDVHGRIVHLVQSGTVSPLPDETMAWHCAVARQSLAAAGYAIQAAEACSVRSAMQEADGLLDLAEKQLALVQAAESGALDDMHLRLLTVRGPVAAALFGRGGERTRSIYERGVSLCADRKDQDRAKWFPLYWGWWYTAPDYETHRARSDILLRDLGGSADPEVRLQSFHCAWATNEDAGLHLHCLKCVEDGLQLYDRDRARFSRGRYGGHDAKVCGLGERAFSLWFLGDDPGSSASIEAAKQWADEINHRNSMLHALEFEIELNRYRNDYAGVIAVADRIAALAHDMPDDLTKAALFRAWAVGMSVDASAGLAEFEEGQVRHREIATYEGAPIYEGMRADLYESAGRIDEALPILDAAIAASIRSGQVFWLPELLRKRAAIRFSRGEPVDEVVADLGRALSVAKEQDAAALVSRVRQDVERLGLQGQIADA